MSSVQNTPSQRIASIELGRVIAILAIIGLHGQMALTYWQINDVPWIGYILNQTARFAVPLFFLISGYLIQPKLVSSPWGNRHQLLETTAQGLGGMEHHLLSFTIQPR